MTAERFVPEDVLIGTSYPRVEGEDTLIDSQPIIVVNLKAIEERAKEKNGFLMQNTPSEEGQSRSNPALLPRKNQ